MIATPRAGLWTPRGRQAPSLMLPYGVAGTEPIGVHSRSGSTPTITRAGTRWFQAGSSIVELAANAHAIEEDGAGNRFASVYGERTNVGLRSQTFDTWSAAYQLTVPTTAVVAPDGATYTTCTLHEDATAAAEHELRDVFAATAGPMVMSVFSKAAARSWLYMAKTFGTPGASQYFDVAAGSLGTGAGVDKAGMVYCGNGWWRCWMAYTEGGTANRNNRLYVAEANNDISFDGLDQDSLYVWGFQVEVGTSVGPYIPTTTAAVTKYAEVISHPVTDLGIPGSVEWIPRTWDTAPTNKGAWAWYDADGDACIESYLDADGHVHLRVHDGTSETADIEVATATNDGAWRRCIAAWETNYVRLRVGDTDAIDTSCAMPDPALLDTFRVGGREAGLQFDGHIKAESFRAYKYRRI